MVRRLFVAEPVVIPRRAHLLLVAEPLQVLGRDAHLWRFPRDGWWMWGFGGHEAIVSVLADGSLRDAYILSDDEFRPQRRRLLWCMCEDKPRANRQVLNDG